MARKLKITWIRSLIGTKERHRGTIRALGLRRLHQSVVQEDTPQLQGMLRLVRSMVSVEEAGHALGVSRSTVWRLIRRGHIPSVRRGGRRLIPAAAVHTRARRQRSAQMAPFSLDHPMFRLIGTGRGGGKAPGARDKHAILDR